MAFFRACGRCRCTAMSRQSSVMSSLAGGRDLLLSLQGRTPRSLMLFVGQRPCRREPQHVIASRGTIPAARGRAPVACSSPGRAPAGTLAGPASRRAEPCAAGPAPRRGSAGSPCPPAACQAWIMPRGARCACAGRPRPGKSRRSPHSRADVAGMPGFPRYTPPAVEVVLVPRDHDPANDQDPGVLHGVQAAAPAERRVPPVKAPRTYSLSGRPGPQRGLVEPATGDTVIRARISATTSAARDATLPGRNRRTPPKPQPATSEISPAPLDGNVRETTRSTARARSAAR